MAKAPRWDDLQAFMAVARTGRLTAAARRMGVEHTTLSRKIARLEADLGIALFDRSPTGYDLTVDGHALLPRAEGMEREALGIWSGSAKQRGGVVGAVRVGAPEAFSTFCFAERIGELSVTHPGLSLELVATPRVFSLSKREADLAIALSRPETGRLHARRLGDYSLALYGSSQYLDAHGRPSNRDELREHTYIGYIDELIFSPELDYFADALPGIAPSIRISNVITQMSATRAGAGLCILPCYIADRQPGLERVASDLVRISRSYWLVSHADTRRLRPIQVVASFIAEIVRELRPALVPSGALPAAAASPASAS